MTHYRALAWRVAAVFCVALTLFPCGGVFAADTMYIKSNDTALQAEDSVKSKVIKKLSAGTAVKVLTQGDKFYKIALDDGAQGWVFKFKLTADAPAGGKDGGGFSQALAGSPRISARESSTASSIRGLKPVSEISENYAKTKGIAVKNVEAVSRMESFAVTPEELTEFLRQGQLGEFVP